MKLLLEFSIHHWQEMVFALIFAALADLLRLGSAIRTGVRHIRNRLAEQSLTRLRNRIVELERYREILRLYLTGERALYLHTLTMILAVLVCICMAAIVLVLERCGLFPNGEIMAIGSLTVAVVFGTYGIRLASMDIRPKVSELLTKLDEEIFELKAKIGKGA